jgi:hypothetical protein
MKTSVVSCEIMDMLKILKLLMACNYVTWVHTLQTLNYAKYISPFKNNDQEIITMTYSWSYIPKTF